MKKRLVFSGMLVCLLALSVAMIGCDTGGGGPGGVGPGGGGETYPQSYSITEGSSTYTLKLISATAYELTETDGVSPSVNQSRAVSTKRSTGTYTKDGTTITLTSTPASGSLTVTIVINNTTIVTIVGKIKWEGSTGNPDDKIIGALTPPSGAPFWHGIYDIDVWNNQATPGLRFYIDAHQLVANNGYRDTGSVISEPGGDIKNGSNAVIGEWVFIKGQNPTTKQYYKVGIAINITTPVQISSMTAPSKIQTLALGLTGLTTLQGYLSASNITWTGNAGTDFVNPESPIGYPFWLISTRFPN